MTQPATAEDQRTAQDREYGVYVATETIFIGGARAFNVGDPVPVSHVERENPPVHKDQVTKVKTAPAGNAGLAEWQEFARTRGATDADLDGKTRDELRDIYSEKG